MRLSHQPTALHRVLLSAALLVGLALVASAGDYDATVVVESDETFKLGKGETIHGDLVVMGGTAEVLGHVSGNIVVVEGKASLRSTARVDGSALTVRGSIDTAAGAAVAGDQRKLSAQEFARGIAGAGETQAPPAQPAAPSEPAAPTPEQEPQKPAQTEAPPDAPKPPPAPEKVERQGDLHSFGGTITVPADEIRRGNVASFGGPVHIRGEVIGDVASMGGPVSVDDGGYVHGNIVSMGGPISLAANSHVSGDIMPFGGSLNRADGARVDGGIHSFPGPDITQLLPGILGLGHRPVLSRAAGRGLTWAWRLVVALIVTLLVVACVPVATKVIADRIFESPGAAAVHGIITILLFLPACVLLAITCIGVLGIPVLFVLLMLSSVLGVVAVKLIFGRQLVKAFGWRVSSILGLAVIGSLLLSAIGLLKVVAPLLVFIPCLLYACVLILGIGGAVMTRLGTDPTGTFITSRLGRANNGSGYVPSYAGHDTATPPDPVPTPAPPPDPEPPTPGPE